MKSNQIKKINGALKLLFILGCASELTACGGNSSTAAAPIKVATSNVSVNLDATTIGVLLPQAGYPAPKATLVYGLFGQDASGANVSVTSTNNLPNTTTLVSFSGTASAPQFRIETGNPPEIAFGPVTFVANAATSTAPATTTCIFTATSNSTGLEKDAAGNTIASAVPITRALYAGVGGVGGKLMKVTPCAVTVKTKNVIPGTTSSLPLTLTLGKYLGADNISYTINQPVTLGTDGTVSVAGILLGTVTIGDGAALP